MQSTGLLKKIAEPILKYAKSTGNLIATTAGTCIFFNLTASDQYLSIVVPGRMFSDSYKKNNLAPENLSRTIEDSGTVTSVLVPWNTCGATQSAILGMHTIQDRPVAIDGEIVIRPMMYLALSYDHRLLDGKEAVSFLIAIKDQLESPEKLLLNL